MEILQSQPIRKKKHIQLKESIINLSNIDLIEDCIRSVVQDEQGTNDDEVVYLIHITELNRRIELGLIK